MVLNIINSILTIINAPIIIGQVNHQPAHLVHTTAGWKPQGAGLGWSPTFTGAGHQLAGFWTTGLI